METYSKAQALRAAQQLGCRGAHKHPDGSWMPCETHDEYVRLEKQQEGKAFTLDDIEENRSKRTIKGNKRRKRKPGWERLGESGVVAIDTISAGLVSGAVSTKSDTHYGRVALRRKTPLIFELRVKRLGRTLRNVARFATARFDPNAFDGDEDGLVQDSTPFERPALPNAPQKTNAETRRARQTGSPSKRFAAWLYENPGYASEISGPHRVVLAQRLRNDGKQGFSSRSRSIDKDIEDAISRILDGVQPPRDGRKKMFFVGGTVSAGKSTLVRNASQDVSLVPFRFAKFPQVGEAAFIDPDEIKLYLEGYDFGRGAQAVHEDSREIADAVMAEAMRRGLSVVVQGTGRGTGYLTDAKQNKYEVYGIMAWTPKELAKRRLAERNAKNAVNGGPQFDESYQTFISESLQEFLIDQLHFDLYNELIVLDTSIDKPRRILKINDKYSSDDMRLLIDDEDAVTEFLGDDAISFLRDKYEKPKSTKKNAGSRFATPRKTNPSPQNLSKSYLDIEKELNKSEKEGIVFGPGIPVTVQHVTSREIANNIIRDGLQVQEEARVGSSFGRGIYFNVEGSRWGSTWAEYSPDPVAISAVYVPRNPLILDEVSSMSLKDFAEQKLGVTLQELLALFEQMRDVDGVQGMYNRDAIDLIRQAIKGADIDAAEVAQILLGTKWIKTKFDSVIVRAAHGLGENDTDFTFGTEIIVYDPSIVRIVGVREYASEKQWEELGWEGFPKEEWGRPEAWDKWGRPVHPNDRVPGHSPPKAKGDK